MQMTNSYLDKIAAEIRRTADPDAARSDEDLPLYRIYAVLLLAKGRDVTEASKNAFWGAFFVLVIWT
jgi:hypothetical protein